jgi:hypothetical protein
MLVRDRLAPHARKRLEPGFGLLAADLSDVCEPIEASDLALSLDARGVPGRQTSDQRADSLAQLKREMRSRGAHQLANVVDRHLTARSQAVGMLRLAHRPRPWEVALTG